MNVFKPVRGNRYATFSLTLLIIAILGPLFHWAGLWLRGLSFFYIDFQKLVAAYIFLAISAGCSSWLILNPPNKLARILAVVGLVLNISSVAYAGRLWRTDSQLLTNTTIWTPFGANKIGILIAPANDGAQAIAEARVIEETITALSESTELAALVETRQIPPVTTLENAKYIAQRMQAYIVVWGTAEGSELVHTEHYVTMMGAGSAADGLDTSSLMLLLSSICTLNTADNRLASENLVPPTARALLAPVSLGFASLAADKPELAAAFFKTALSAPNLSDATKQAILAQYGLALLLADRPDLAEEIIAQAQLSSPSALSQVAEGNLALYQGNVDRANNAYLQARALDPRLAQAYCGLGIVASEQANLGRASSLFSQALSLEPDCGLINLLQAHLSELQGDSNAAQATYEQAAEKLYPFDYLKDVIAQRRQELAISAPTPVPTATFAPTPSPMPIPGQRYHTVAKNETLRQIAELYNVSEDDIIKLNRLEDRNVLYIGQVLTIPEE